MAAATDVGNGSPATLADFPALKRLAGILRRYAFAAHTAAVTLLFDFAAAPDASDDVRRPVLGCH